MHIVRQSILGCLRGGRQILLRPLKPINSTLSSRAIATPPGKFINVDGINIHYEHIGHGDHVVLFMIGAVGHTRVDFGELERMDPNKFTVIAWDAPGYGFSRPPNKTFSIDYLSQDAKIATKFVKALGISKLSVVGWCNGGCTAVLFAAQNQHMMNKLVPISCHSRITDLDVEWFQKHRDINSWDYSLREKRVKIYGQKDLSETFNRFVDILSIIPAKKNGNICADEAKMVKCPTLLLYGSNDTIIRRKQLDILHENINNSKLIVLEGATHQVPLSHPDEFYNLVQSFLLK